MSNLSALRPGAFGLHVEQAPLGLVYMAPLGYRPPSLPPATALAVLVYHADAGQSIVVHAETNEGAEFIGLVVEGWCGGWRV